jgi:hypothetical protein
MKRAPQVACLMKDEEGVGFHAQPCCYPLKSTVMERLYTIIPLFWNLTTRETEQVVADSSL